MTLVEGELKAPFSIATTPRCRGGRYSFSWIAPLYPWYVPYIGECYARRYQVPFLKSLLWRDAGLNPGLANHWWTLYPLDQWAVYIHVLTHKAEVQDDFWRWMIYLSNISICELSDWLIMACQLSRVILCIEARDRITNYFCIYIFYLVS